MINIAIFIGRCVAWHYVIRGALTLGRQFGDAVREAHEEAKANGAQV